MYWLNWALTGIAELSAVGLYVQFWFPNMPTWATVLIALAVVLVSTCCPPGRSASSSSGPSSSRSARSSSSWRSVVVVVVFGFNIGGHTAGFSNLWSNPGGFWPTEDPYIWYGPILVMSGVVFAYAAIEMVGVAAGEMEDSKTRGAQGRQRRHLPDRRLLLRVDPAAGLACCRPPSTRPGPARSSRSSSGWAWPG